MPAAFALRSRGRAGANPVIHHLPGGGATVVQRPRGQGVARDRFRGLKLSSGRTGFHSVAPHDLHQPRAPNRVCFRPLNEGKTQVSLWDGEAREQRGHRGHQSAPECSQVGVQEGVSGHIDVVTASVVVQKTAELSGEHLSENVDTHGIRVSWAEGTPLPHALEIGTRWVVSGLPPVEERAVVRVPAGACRPMARFSGGSAHPPIPWGAQRPQILAGGPRCRDSRTLSVVANCARWARCWSTCS